MTDEVYNQYKWQHILCETDMKRKRLQHNINHEVIIKPKQQGNQQPYYSV